MLILKKAILTTRKILGGVSDTHPPYQRSTKKQPKRSLIPSTPFLMDPLHIFFISDSTKDVLKVMLLDIAFLSFASSFSLAEAIVKPLSVDTSLPFLHTTWPLSTEANYVQDIDLFRGGHPFERRPACAILNTDHKERGRCFDTHVQVSPLDERQGPGRCPTDTQIASRTEHGVAYRVRYY